MYLSTKFEYNNIKSVDMDCICAYVELNDFTEHHFGLNRKVSLDKIGDKTILNNIDNENIEFDMTIAKIKGDKWTDKERKIVCEWLFQDDFKPLRICDNPFLVYYVMFTEKSTRHDNGCNEGYVNCHVICKNPYAFTNIGWEKVKCDGEGILTIRNLSNLNAKIYPTFEIESLANQTIEFFNTTSRETPSVIKNVKLGEKIILNNLEREIFTSIDEYKLKDFNKKWFSLTKGYNRIQIKGKMNLDIKYQYHIVV